MHASEWMNGFLRCGYLGNTGAYDSTSDRQKVSYISGPGNGVSGQLRTHWQTWAHKKGKQKGNLYPTGVVFKLHLHCILHGDNYHASCKGPIGRLFVPHILPNYWNSKKQWERRKTMNTVCIWRQSIPPSTLIRPHSRKTIRRTWEHWFHELSLQWALGHF